MWTLARGWFPSPFFMPAKKCCRKVLIIICQYFSNYYLCCNYICCNVKKIITYVYIPSP